MSTRILWGGAVAASQYEGSGRGRRGLDSQDCRPYLPRTSTATTETRLLTADALREATSGTSDRYYPLRQGVRGAEHWDEDLELITELGLDVFRLSLSWVRLFPTGFEEEPDPDGVAFYDEVIRSLHDRRIRVFVTLNHYAIPVEIINRYGGWKDRRTIDLYVRMAEFAVERWGDLVDYWLPINEINAGYFSPYNGLGLLRSPDGEYDYSDVFNGLHYQMVASARITEFGHRLGVPGRFVAMVSCFCYYALTPTPEDNSKLVHDEQINQWYCMDVLARGEYGYYVEPFLEAHGATLDVTPEDRKVLRENTCDVVSFSYYSSSICSESETHVQTPGNLVATIRNPELKATEWGWQIDPVGLRTTLHKVYDRYGKPVMVAENGLGARDVISPDGRVHDDYRVEYMSSHFTQAERAREEGVDVEAYLVWGVIDIVSAGSCEMDKRYGVVHVDAGNEGEGSFRRLRKDSFFWLKEFVSTQRGERS